MKRTFLTLLLLWASITIAISSAESYSYDSKVIFENHNSVMLLIDSSTGDIVDANDAAAKFYGYSKEELKSMKISDINTLTPDEVKMEMEAAINDQRSYFEFKHQLKDGSIKDVEVYSSPASDSKGSKLLFSIVHDITARKVAENEAHKSRMAIYGLLGTIIAVLVIAVFTVNRIKKDERDSKNKLKSLFDNMNEGFAVHEIIVDANGAAVDYRFLDANKAFEKVTGLDIDRVRNKTVKEVFPNIEQSWIDTYGEVAIKGNSINFSNYSSELDKHFHINVYSPSHNKFVTIFTDITTEIKAQEQLENEKGILETILEDTLSGYWDWNLKTNEEYLSPSFKSMLGYRDDELENTPESWQKLIYKEDLSFVKEQYDKHVKSRGRIPFYNDVRYHHKSGATIWVICSGRVIEWDGDKPLRMVGCHINITRIKELEQTIREERNLFKTTLHSIGDGVISTDHNGNIDIMNVVAERMTGWSNEEAKGIPFVAVFNIMNEYSRSKCFDPVERVLETGEVVELENNTVLVSRLGEEIPVEDSAAPIRDEHGRLTGVVVVFRDCTEKREKQQKIQYLSYHDQLTGLYNRHFFEEELSRLDVERNLPFTIAMVDVNGLKLTNDAFGHGAGDMLLKKVAEVLKKECRTDDIISRIGGDEFVILLPKTSRQDAELVVRRIHKAIEHQGNANIVISISIGLETKESSDQEIKEIFAKAEDYMYRNKITESQSMRNQTIKVIMQTLNEANKREKLHSERVSKLCRKIGEAMELDDETLRELEMTGLMHDIGKIAINNDILNKPGKLTEIEYEEIKKHPEISYHILKSADVYTRLAEHVLSHHERWDGKGYPRGISGEEIPLPARIIAVADAYEAMTASRPYKRSFSHDEAIDELKRCAGTQFDPVVIAACIKEWSLLE